MNAEGDAAAQLDVAIGRLLDQPAHPIAVADDDLLATARLLHGVLLAGGAIAWGASLAISIAGAALLAWRRVRASGETL